MATKYRQRFTPLSSFNLCCKITIYCLRYHITFASLDVYVVDHSEPVILQVKPSLRLSPCTLNNAIIVNVYLQLGYNSSPTTVTYICNIRSDNAL